MKKVCHHCNKEIEYERKQQFGAHLTNCKSNPKREKNQKDRREKLYKIYVINCLFCDKEYELELTENQYKKGKYKKCCSTYCAHQIPIKYIDHNKTKKSNCIKCGIEIEIKLNASKKTCICNECRQYNIKKPKIKNCKIKNKKIVDDNKIVCSLCGQEKCSILKICKSWISGRSKTFIKLGFDITKLGSLQFYEEYNRIIKLIKKEYENNSQSEIGEKYNINSVTIQKTFDNLGIIPRNFSDSTCLSIKKGKLDINRIPYKSGYHTSWEGKTFWYRSSYELDYCKELDKNKIKYEMEKIKIKYFDTIKNCNRTAIPDFYLIDNNELVEIKGTWTYDEQNMIDKIKAYKENGYNVKLILEHKIKTI